MEKTNALNNEAPVIPTLVAGIWSAIPVETSSSIAWIAVVCAGLFAVRDKIPKEV